MARIEQKKPVAGEKGNSTLNKVFFGIGVGLLSAIAILLIVILVMWIVDKSSNKKDNKEFDPTYTTENVIGMGKLDKILDNDKNSGYFENNEFIYVFIYSPDYKTNKPYDKADFDYQERLEKAVNDLSKLDTGFFFIVNVEDKDNKEWLGKHEGFFGNYGIDAYPTFIKVGAREEGTGKGILNKDDMDSPLEVLASIEKLVKDNK